MSSVRSSADDPVARAIAAGVDQIRTAVLAVSASNPVVLIDGRSGAGKTSLSKELVKSWPLLGHPQVIALDSIYPGWDGLAAGVHRATADILRPHGRGLHGTWHRWDWDVQADAEPHVVDPALALVLEGCGAITPTTARLADVTVWVDAPDMVRRHRALTRDGEAFRPHWERWAAQEQEHIDTNDPRGLATVRVTIP